MEELIAENIPTMEGKCLHVPLGLYGEWIVCNG